MSGIAGGACRTEPKQTEDNRYRMQRNDKGCGNLSVRLFRVVICKAFKRQSLPRDVIG